MPGIVLATIAFFIAGYYLKRYLEGMDIPKGPTRGVLIFSLALAISYLVAWGVDHLS